MSVNIKMKFFLVSEQKNEPICAWLLHTMFMVVVQVFQLMKANKS